MVMPLGLEDREAAELGLEVAEAAPLSSMVPMRSCPRGSRGAVVRAATESGDSPAVVMGDIDKDDPWTGGGFELAGGRAIAAIVDGESGSESRNWDLRGSAARGEPCRRLGIPDAGVQNVVVASVRYQGNRVMQHRRAWRNAARRRR